MQALAPTPAPAPFAEAEAQFGALVSHLSSEEALSMTHSDLERELDKKGRELLRSLLQAHLDLRSPGPASEPVRDAEGQERTQQRVHRRSLATVFGKVEVERLGYRAEGAESLHPLDAELNLPPERYSHELRRRAAVEVAKGSYDEAVEALATATGTAVPKRQLEELIERAAQDFDAFYAGRSTGPESTEPLLVLTVDGKGVVMRREDLRPATQKAAEQRRHKLSKRLSPGEKRNARRMATVAAVYTVAPFARTPEEVAGTLAPVHRAVRAKRPRPEAKRVWASLEKEPEKVIEDAFQEALQRDPQRRKRWVALVDGAEHPLRLLHRAARRHHVELTLVLDIVHVTEYLWKAATVFCPKETPERDAWVSRRLLNVLQGYASQVAGGIRRSATLRGLTPEQRKPADTCADYLLKYAPYLRYDEYLAAGLPIATGVIEGACRHLVKDRMELTGARWSLAGAEAVLRLRALRSSGDFDEYWRFHEAREYRRNHQARYADHHVPPTQPRARRTPSKGGPHLKIVK